MPELYNQALIVFYLFVNSGRQDTFVTNVNTTCIKETVSKMELHSGGSRATSFSFLLAVSSLSFSAMPSRIFGGNLLRQAGRKIISKNNPFLLEQVIRKNLESVRAESDWVFGYHRIRCSIFIGLSVRGGADFTYKVKRGNLF